jgi:hypothetical protein
VPSALHAGNAHVVFGSATLAATVTAGSGAESVTGRKPIWTEGVGRRPSIMAEVTENIETPDLRKSSHDVTIPAELDVTDFWVIHHFASIYIAKVCTLL